MEWLRLELMEVASNLARLAIAYVLALPIAWDRERSERRFGLRTFPLVAVASCSFMLLSHGVPDATSDALYGVITGVGFLGAGIIIKQNRTVRGVATAGAIWTTTAVGVGAAQRDYGIAIAVSALTFFTLRWLETLKLLREEKPDEQPGKKPDEKPDRPDDTVRADDKPKGA